MKYSSQKLCSLIVAISFFLGLAATSTYADDTTSGPFIVQASLMTPRQISLGEPILLRYEIANASSEKALTHLGVSGTDWYTLTMQDDHGVDVPLISALPQTHRQEAYSSKSGFFRAGVSDVDYILINNRLSIQHPGQYVLTMHVKLPYITGAALTAGTPEALVALSGLTQTQEITFPILVTPTDPKHLQDTAEALLRAAQNSPDGQFGRAEMDALFSMPEAQAAVSWKVLALKPSMSNDLAASELESLHSQTSVDLLVQMLDTPGLNCVALGFRIDRLYNAGTPALREHIKTLAKHHGFEMPHIAGVPTVVEASDPNSGGIAF